MKTYLLGILTMFFIGFSLQLIWYKGLDSNNDKMVGFGFYGGEAIRGIYFIKPLTNRCTKRKRCKKPDCSTNIEYFNCGKVQVLLNNIIYGEYNESKN